MNAKLPDGVVNIHGKEYQTVALRVKQFRDAHPAYTLATKILHRDESCVVMEAQILDEQGRMIANGHAEEYRTSSSINKTSALENSETSALGRALAAFGIGGTEFASADEVANAINNKQPAKPKSVAKETLETLGEEEQQYLSDLAMEVLSQWPDEARTYAAYMDAKKGLDAHEQVAFWAHFDSKQRAAIKRQGQLEMAGQS